MSASYVTVGWNRQKKIYDAILAASLIAYLALFIAVSFVIHPTISAETAILRALATGAIILLHVILSIGPLCRLNRRFLPLLYNRRHLGVTMFFLALGHGVLATLQFHAFTSVNPLLSIFITNTAYNSLAGFPFEVLGFFALVILFTMAATSHDFWLANLSAPVWKALHMLVYVAYALVVGHVALGSLQSETHMAYPLMVGLGVLWLSVLHVAAARKEVPVDRELGDGPWVDVCALEDIPEDRARIFCMSGERVAVFKYDGKLSAVSNVCKHQNGPLGEGKVVDGCITCPWHGYQYRPEDGASPPPFTEKVPTFAVRLQGDRVLVDPQPRPAGTRIEPARIETMEV